MTAPSEIYLAAVDRVARRARSWSAAEASTVLPTCPEWRAHDLVAHLAGGAADHASGRLDGFPGPGWTARHVAERSSRPTADVVDELLALAGATAARCDASPAGPNSSWDAYIHERDLAAAFEPDDAALDEHGHVLLAEMVAFLDARAPVELALARRGDAVQLVLVATQRHDATVAASAAFRVVSGRAPAAAAQSWAWSPDAPSPELLRHLRLFA